MQCHSYNFYCVLIAEVYFLPVSVALNRIQQFTCIGRTFFAIPLTKAEDSKAAPYLALHHVIHHHLEEQVISTAVTILQASFPNKLNHKPDACIPKVYSQPLYCNLIMHTAPTSNWKLL